MEQRADHLVFVGAVLHRDSGHPQDVGHVRDGGALAELSVVDLASVDDGRFKASHVAKPTVVVPLFAPLAQT